MGNLGTGTIRSLILALTFTTALASADYEIDSCGTVITDPGNYSLSSDLLSCAGVGIFIVSSDVSLNMKEHSISCDRVDGRLDVAVGAFNVENVSVSNGRVEFCDAGILFELVSDSAITNMLAVRNDTADAFLGGGFGIFAGNTVKTKIRGNHLSENIVGLRVAGDRNKIVGNTAIQNFRSDGNTLLPSFGIGIGVSGNQNEIVGNMSAYNSDTGIVLVNDSRGNTVRGNVANNNGIWGIATFSREDFGWPLASENLIQSNEALGNGRSDLTEAKLDPNENPPELVQGQCVNEWKNNDFVSTIGPEYCFN